MISFVVYIPCFMYKIVKSIYLSAHVCMTPSSFPETKYYKCVNPLNPTIIYKIFKNSARTSKGTPHFTITMINSLMLFE
jgi:hypothetical protein